MQELTERQREALEVIKRHIKEHGYPPTVRELIHEMGGTSSSHGVYYLEALERKGYIERDHSPRAIRVIRDNGNS